MLIAGHAVSRFASTTLIHFLDYARDDDSSKSKPLATRMGRGELALAALCGLAPCALLPLPRVAVALGLVTLVTWLAARWFRRRIGGYTGDCLGATQQLTEIAFYLGLLCAGPLQAQHAPLWGAASAFASVGG
jgi:adenosylcobinamide-GDP ribazoletransferase